MASLLAKFRIDYSDLQIVPDITSKALDCTQQFFDTLIADFRKTGTETTNNGNFFLKSYKNYYNCDFFAFSFNFRRGIVGGKRENQSTFTSTRIAVAVFAWGEFSGDDATNSEEKYCFGAAVYGVVGIIDEGYAADSFSPW